MRRNLVIEGPDGEIWKEIPGYEGHYAVSSLGRVTSLARVATNGTHRKPRILHAWLTQGYPTVSLSIGSKVQNRAIHLLVLLAFVGPQPQGYETRHLNGNREDNRLDNLQYGTPLENNHDRITHGTTNRGERCGTHKLTEEQVVEIRKRYAAGGVLHRELAAEYGVARETVGKITRCVNWRFINA